MNKYEKNKRRVHIVILFYSFTKRDAPWERGLGNFILLQKDAPWKRGLEKWEAESGKIKMEKYSILGP